MNVALFHMFMTFMTFMTFTSPTKGQQGEHPMQKLKYFREKYTYPSNRKIGACRGPQFTKFTGRLPS